MGAMLGLLMIYTGTIIGSAFLLTKPPAVSELGASELATVGLVSLVILVFFGVQQFATFFKTKITRTKYCSSYTNCIHLEPKFKNLKFILLKCSWRGY